MTRTRESWKSSKEVVFSSIAALCGLSFYCKTLVQIILKSLKSLEQCKYNFTIVKFPRWPLKCCRTFKWKKHFMWMYLVYTKSNSGDIRPIQYIVTLKRTNIVTWPQYRGRLIFKTSLCILKHTFTFLRSMWPLKIILRRSSWIPMS